MSYSFTVTAASKAEALQQVSDKLDQVVEAQPSHAADRLAAFVTAAAFLSLLQEPREGDQVVGTVNGWLSWNSASPEEFKGASVGVNFSLQSLPKAA